MGNVRGAEEECLIQAGGAVQRVQLKPLHLQLIDHHKGTRAIPLSLSGSKTKQAIPHCWYCPAALLPPTQNAEIPHLKLLSFNCCCTLKMCFN